MTEPVPPPKKSKLMDDEGGEGMSDNNLGIKLLDESNQLLNIFPELVWLNVLDQLELQISDSNSSLEQVSNASQYFRKLLLPKRTFFLFPPVLTLLNAANRGNVSKPSKLRSVCLSWNKSVDSVEQETRDNQRLRTQMNRFRRGDVDITSNFFDSSGAVQNFIQHFKDTHPSNCERSPFIIRDVDLSLNYIRTWSRAEFATVTCNMLQVHGHHIWNLRIYNSYDLPYLLLKDWLTSMVNLKSLIFFPSNPQLNRRHSVPVPIEPPADILIDLLPKLNSLHTLDNFELPLPPRLLTEILRNCNQISTLLLGLGSLYNTSRIVMAPLPNLQHLQVRFEAWNQISQIDWTRVGPTKPLYLSLSTVSCEFVEWRDYFGFIQNSWGNKLHLLSLVEMPKARTMEHCLSIRRDSVHSRLQLPKLSHLDLYIPTMAHLDFILGTTESLGYLNIVVSDFAAGFKVGNEFYRAILLEENRLVPKIQFHRYEGKMLESNIWEMLPNLDELWVKYDSTKYKYKRAQWVLSRQSNDN